MAEFDAVVVGAGPNGLAAAITLAKAGSKVLVVEAEETAGGGTRSAELTLPGHIHDVCSAIHPLGVASPFFRDLPLGDHGLVWEYPTASLAHPLEDGTATLVTHSVEETAERLGRDAAAYRALIGPIVRHYDRVLHEFLGPLRFPRYPFTLTSFGVRALFPATTMAKLAFRTGRARALFAGMAAHSIMPLEWPATAAFGIMLTMLAHAVGWPMAQGGSQKIADALVSYLGSLDSKIQTGQRVESIKELPPARLYLFDVTPRQLLHIAGDRLPAGYRRQLMRYRHGAGVFKVDYALKEPIPWRAPEASQGGTVHLGGSFEEIVASEGAAYKGQHSERPFVLLAQQSLFDPTRAPQGKHTAWAYCHVPNGSDVDMIERIEAQIERFAPGFRDCVSDRFTRSASQYETYNANYIGGDINGGVQNLRQLFTRPAIRLVPYSTPDPQIFLCSSSTPPGGGVHGMCGYYSARAALRSLNS